MLEYSVRRAKVHTASELATPPPLAELNIDSSGVLVSVVADDIVQATQALSAVGFYPCLLNMANATSPGGSVELGVGAQEEELCRRSNLLLSLQRLAEDGYYPLPPAGAAYSPSVCFFRSDGANGYGWWGPRCFGVVSAAAVCLPHCVENVSQLPTNWVDEMSTAIFAILATVQLYHHDSVVLSAFGCGAFRNPPREVALLFKEQLQYPRFRRHFKCVTFAIFDECGENFDAFATVLGEAA